MIWLYLCQVKALPGLGTTVDVILVNGKIKEGDTIIMPGTDGPIATQVRGLLMPQPMKELRVKVRRSSTCLITCPVGFYIHEFLQSFIPYMKRFQWCDWLTAYDTYQWLSTPLLNIVGEHKPWIFNLFRFFFKLYNSLSLTESFFF